MLKNRKGIAILGVLVLLLAACGPAATPTTAPTVTRATATPAPSPTPAGPKAGGTLRLGGTGSPTSMDIHGATRSDESIAFDVADTLVHIDYDWSLKPWLAESWTTPDPKTIVFKIRKGVKFHDGTSLDANVVKWNIDRILDPKTISPFARASLKDLASVEVVDESTLKFNLKVPSLALLFNLGMYYNGMMSPDAVAKQGKVTRPIGTGAFLFDEYVTDVRWSLNRNPNWWNGPRPYLNRVENMIVPDERTLVANLQTGAIDTIPDIFYPENVATAQKIPGLTLTQQKGLGTFALMFNLNRPPVDNLALRQAINLAIDREALVELALGGMGDPVNSLVTTAFKEHNTSLLPPKRDLAKAKELMAQAGYPAGLTMELSWWPGVKTITEVLQSQLGEIGIKFTLKFWESGFAGVVMNKADYQLWVGNVSWLPIDNRTYNWLHSKGGYNSGRFGSQHAAILDPLVDTAINATDWSVRKAAYDKIQQYAFAEQVLDIPLIGKYVNTAALNKVQGFRPYVDSFVFYDTWMKE